MLNIKRLNARNSHFIVIAERLTCHVGIWRQPCFPRRRLMIMFVVGVVGSVRFSIVDAWWSVGAAAVSGEEPCQR